MARVDRASRFVSASRAGRSSIPAPMTRRLRRRSDEVTLIEEDAFTAQAPAANPPAPTACSFRALAPGSPLRRKPASGRAAWYSRIAGGAQRADDSAGQGAVDRESSRPRASRASSWSSASPRRAMIKHTNPCGAATGATMAEAYVRARDADRSPRSAASSASIGRSTKTPRGRSCRRSSRR